MQYPLLHLSLAGHVLAPDSYFAFVPYGAGAADRARIRHFKFFLPASPFGLFYLDYLRYDLTAFLYYDVVAYAYVFALYLVDIMKRGARYHCSQRWGQSGDHSDICGIVSPENRLR